MSILRALPALLEPFRRIGSAPNVGNLSIAARLAVATVIGWAAGAVTEWSVLHVPFVLEPVSNTAAPWVFIAFAVALTARSMGESLVLAVVTLVALVLGFYVAEAVRGWSVSRHQVVFWSVTSAVVGPLVGVAASWFHRAGRIAAGLGVGVVGGLLVGEAVHGLIDLRFSSPAGYWYVQLALGVGLALGLTLWRCWRRHIGSVPALAASMAACAIAGLGTLAAYRLS